jgi:methyltransferase (TIGR00027 family)
MRTALHRALHQLIDRPPVLDDPVAISLLGRETADELRRDPARFERNAVDRYLRAFVVARARFAEDQLGIARAAGVRQFVVLGAGLDTFAYRSSLGPSLRFWEVDYPATQAWKRLLLHDAGIGIPDGLTYVPLDLEQDALAPRLAGAGFDGSAGAVFSWLGVTPYLTEDAVFATLAAIAGATGPFGAVVFDYMLSPALLSDRQRLVFDRMSGRVEAAGEEWRSSFEPGSLVARIKALGFQSAEDFGPEALNAGYFRDRDDGLRVGGMAHIMRAGGDGVVA